MLEAFVIAELRGPLDFRVLQGYTTLVAANQALEEITAVYPEGGYVYFIHSVLIEGASQEGVASF